MKKGSLTQLIRRIGAASVVLMATFALSSCGNDDESTGPTLPEFKDFTVAVGENKSVDFKATATWTIASDKAWCIPTPKTGGAGDQKVTFEITDANQTFNDDFANVTFATGTLSTTFKVTRSAKLRQVKLYSDAECTQEVEAIAITSELVFGNYGTVAYVKANIDWKLDAASLPSWIDAENLTDITGVANEAKLIRFNVNFKNAPTGNATAPVKFTESVGSFEYSANVTFGGVEDVFTFVDANLSLVKFDNKGNLKDGETSTYQKWFQFDAYAAKKGYVFVFLGWNEAVQKYGWGMDENCESYAFPTWPSVEESEALPEVAGTVLGATQELRVTENKGKKRKAAVFCVPVSLATAVTEDPAMLLDESMQTPGEEYDRYYCGAIEQDADNSVTELTFSGEGVTLESYTGGNWGVTIGSTKTEVVLTCTYPGGETGISGFVIEGNEEAPLSPFKVNEWLTVTLGADEMMAGSCPFTLTLGVNSTGVRREVGVNFVLKNWDTGMYAPVGSLWVTQSASGAKSVQFVKRK